MKPPEQQPSPDGLEISTHEVADEEIAMRLQEAENDPSVWLTWEELASGLRHGS